MKTVKTKFGRMPMQSPVLKFLVWAFLVLVVMSLVGVAFGTEIPRGAAAVLKTAADLVKSEYREGPNNDTIFGEWYGMNHQPWCGMVISWCFKENGIEKLVAAQSKKGFAKCSIALRWFEQNKQIVPVERARPGDIVFYRFGKDGKTHHVGLVVENYPDKGLMSCIEGNTSSDEKGSQRDGDGVFKKMRSYNEVMKVAHPKYE